MVRSIESRNMDRVHDVNLDLISEFKSAFAQGKPWENIEDFATHKSFCGKRLYPRQRTLLKLIYLETENMTSYDLAVIEEWRKNFGRADSCGVQPDIWERVEFLKDNGYDHFPHVQAVQGRRASKGLVGGILGAERIGHLLSLGDPQEYYGIDRNKDIYFTVVATNSNQAKRFQFADLKETVDGNPWLAKHLLINKDTYISLQTSADIRKVAELKMRGVPVEGEVASIKAIPTSSTSASGRGGAGFMNFYDEFAHMIVGGSSRSSDEVYEAFQPSLDQFGKDSMTYIPSSPFTKVGKFYELYTNGSILVPQYLEKIGKFVLKEETEKSLGIDAEEELDIITSNPEMLIVQLPSWELYKDWEEGPKLVGIRFKRPIQYEPGMDSPESQRMLRQERANPTKFKVERKAQFAEVISGYLDEDSVDSIFKPFWDGRILYQQDAGALQYAYHMHSDPSRTNANFALAIGHLEKSPVPDEEGNYWNHVVFDKTHVWKPTDFETGKVDYTVILRHFKEILRKFPSTELATFDQWNSAAMIDSLAEYLVTTGQSTTVREAVFSGPRNEEVAEKFKSAINLEWVHAPKDELFGGEQCLLENELKFLSEVNGKVQKQEFGPVTTKDLADCVMEVTVRLLEGQIVSATRKKLSESRPSAGLQGGYPATNSKAHEFSSDLRERLGGRSRGESGLYARTRGRR